MTFEKAKAHQAALERELSEAEATLKTFPRNAMGLTPDATRSTPEWSAAKARVTSAFAALRNFNAVFVKAFKKELRAERANRFR